MKLEDSVPIFLVLLHRWNDHEVEDARCAGGHIGWLSSSNAVARPCGGQKVGHLRGLRVLADQPAETIASHHSRANHHEGWPCRSEGWRLSQRAVRPMRVVVVNVFAQQRLQMASPKDQHPVEQLPSYRAHPALCISVGPRSPHRGLEHIDTCGGEDRVELR